MEVSHLETNLLLIINSSSISSPRHTTRFDPVNFFIHTYYSIRKLPGYNKHHFILDLETFTLSSKYHTGSSNKYETPPSGFSPHALVSASIPRLL